MPRINVLGPLEVYDHSGLVDLGTPKQRAVLAMLAVEPNRVVSVDRIVDQLWGEEPPVSALGSLHAYVSNLRRILEPDRPPRSPSRLLVSRAPGYLLAADADQVDALVFEALVAAGRTHLVEGRPEQAREHLRQGLSLWRGPVLADFSLESFIAPATRLEELRRAAAEDLVDTRLALGEHTRVVSELEELVLVEPLRERAWAQLVLALYRCGRQAESLRAFHRARGVLGDELGLEPGPELRRLEQAVLAQDPALDWVAPPSSATEPALSPPAVRRSSRSERSAPPAPEEDAHLVGRREQLDRLESLLTGLAAGGGGVLLVSGEPGVGKTALLAELARRARSLGLKVGWGQSPEDSVAPLLWPWAQALRDLGEGGPFTLPASADAGDGTAPNPADLFALALDHLHQVSADAPVVVVLDDLQWADEMSHQLLQLALAVTTDHPVLLAVGLREPVEAPSSHLVATRASLARLSSLERLSLGGLDRESVSELARMVVGEPASDDVIAAVHDRTGGNPFFVTELVRLLSAQRALHDRARMEQAGVPVGARDVVRRRLTRLPEQAVVVLGVAAVVGPRIDIGVLSRMTAIGADELVDLLELATVAGLVAEDDNQPGQYRFSHDLVREAIYYALPGLRRARLHHEAMQALRATHGESAAITHELARHAVSAVPALGPDQAVTCLYESARVAQLQMAVELAERQLQLGLQLLTGSPTTTVRRLNQAEFESRMAQLGFHLRGDVADAAARLERARSLLPAEGDQEQVASVLLGHSALLLLWGEVQEGVEIGERLIELARRTGDQQALSDGRYCVAFGMWGGDVEAAVAAIEASVEGARAVERQGGPPPRAHVPLPCKIGLQAIAYALAGDHARSRAAGRQALEESQGPWDREWGGAWALVAAALGDDPAEVMQLWAATTEAEPSIEYTAALIGACRAWAEVRADGRGDAERVAELSAARRRLAASGDGLMTVPLGLLEARLWLEGDYPEKASPILAEAQAHAARHHHRIWEERIEALLVETKSL